jgi:hypothetical protein
VGFDRREPREYTCDGCNRIDDEFDAHMAHRRECPKVLPVDRTKAGKAQGPDILATNVMPDASLASCGSVGADGEAVSAAANILIDVTVVAACAPSHAGQSVGAMFEAAAAVKARKYAAMATRRREPLYVAAATHLGHLSKPLHELIRCACVKGRLEPSDAWTAVSAKVAFASAAILRSAEARRHLIHRPAIPQQVARLVYAVDAPPGTAPPSSSPPPDGSRPHPPSSSQDISAPPASDAAAPATPPPPHQTPCQRQPPAATHAAALQTPGWLAAPHPDLTAVHIDAAPQTPLQHQSKSDAAPSVARSLVM